jgi:hypothetical protein
MSPGRELKASDFLSVGGWKGTASSVEVGEYASTDPANKLRICKEVRHSAGYSFTLDTPVKADDYTFLWKGKGNISIKIDDKKEMSVPGSIQTETWNGEASFPVDASLSINILEHTYTLEVMEGREVPDAWVTHRGTLRQLHKVDIWIDTKHRGLWIGLAPMESIPLPKSEYNLAGKKHINRPLESPIGLEGAVDIAWNLSPTDDAVDRAVRKKLDQLKKKAQERRDKAKKASAVAAVGMNDTATVLAGTAAVLGAVAAGLATTGVGVPAAAGVALVAGVASAVAWYMGDRYQELANDPPRDDFQIVSWFEPVAFKLQKPANDLEATWQNFTAKNVRLASAMRSLVLSLERCEGAAVATGTRARAAEIKQIEAIVHNATACAQWLDEIAALRSEVNLAWGQLRHELVSAGYGTDSMTPREWRDNLTKVWQASKPGLHRKYKLLSSDLMELEGVVDQRIQEQSSPPNLPRMLLDATWAKSTKDVAAHLRNLSTAYNEVKKTMT